MTASFFSEIRAEVDRAQRQSPNGWGDRLDVRYYLALQLSQLRGKHVLDIGCGPGLLLSVLHPSNKIEGWDTNPEAIRAARRNAPRAHLITKEFKLKHAGRFDVVVLAHMIEDNDPKQFVKRAAKALRKGGRLYLTTPNGDFAKYRNTGLPRRTDLERLLSPYFDFRIYGWNPFPPWPWFPPARILARLPGWFELLRWLCEHNILVNNAKSFYVEAMRR